MTYTYTLIESGVNPLYLAGFERRSLTFTGCDWVLIERHFGVFNGVEDAGIEVIRILYEDATGKYEVSATIEPDGTAGTTSVTKINALRNRRLEDGVLQELMDRVCAFYKSEAGQKAWRRQASLDIYSEIEQHRKEIKRLQNLFGERIAE